MDWLDLLDAAYCGVDCDPTITYAVSCKQWDVIHALQLICAVETWNTNDGRYCMHSISDLEPTFEECEHNWDYEWPNDFVEKGKPIPGQWFDTK